ncbi:c-type cytochrome [Phaeovibrio sulfidiphilus]|uniref:C-type cytochrome n=1 Tax=Phaeovibrio sulfidiphilus TaxID=1220600 RepID=A0A8J7CQ79_9PROT|nr:c-type cytochrome [Phaeovibrio sulfidiphilus]MBE1237937.1 c-type cytochrome [Phaeovibrio sulfidiphilus]
MKKVFLAAGMAAAVALGAGSAEAADAARGKQLMQQKCFTCHYFEPGGPGKVKKTGPYLFGVYGRTIGTWDSFKYSPGYVALGQKGMTWTDANIGEYIADPKPFIQKNTGDPKARSNMSFRLKVPNENAEQAAQRKTDTDDIIAFLKTLK